MLEILMIKYRSMDLGQLIKAWNDLEVNEDNIADLFVISTNIIGRYCKVQRSLLRSLESLASSAVSVIISRIVDPHKRWTLSDISRLVDDDVRALGSLMFSSTDFIRMEDPFELDENIEDNSMDFMNSAIYDEAISDLMEETPSHLKMMMAVFIKTGELLIHNYSDQDKLTVWLILTKLGVNILTDDISFEFYDKLDTATQKAVFLQILRIDYPDIFTLYSVVKDINTIMYLTSFANVLKVSLPEIVNSLDLSAKKALLFVDGKIDLDLSDYDFYLELSKNMLFTRDRELRFDHIVRNKILPIYSEWNDRIDKMMRNPSTSIRGISSAISTELNESIKVIGLLNTVVDEVETTE